MHNTNFLTRNIPNLLTTFNLLSGCISIVLSFQDYLILSSYFIFIAAVFDFSDGFVARLLNAHSEIGKQLDSLADIISFGLAPSVILFKILLMSLVYSDASFSFDTANMGQLLILYSAFLVTVFSAIRLAKFNIDERQTSEFIGLPTPACAIFIASISLILFQQENQFVQSLILNSALLLIFTFILCFLLVSNIRMFALKFKSPRFQDNYLRYIFLGISLILLVFYTIYAIPFIIILYILASLLNNWIFKLK
jgi:CDP-diacylglycerol---serine O-phosphatidyltransferase